MKFPKLLILPLLALCGFLLLHQQLFFQYLLSPGDHGRDLYCFTATLNGERPYTDYWWVYGPLMPYYYSIFLKLFGVSIKSVLIGQLVLSLISGLLCFLTLALFIPPLIAFTGALWFWSFNPEFFFTFNHVGGITVLMGITYCLFLYIKNQRINYLYFLLGLSLILSLIKINFGIAACFVSIAFIYLTDRINRVPFDRAKMNFFIASLMFFPLIIILLYSGLTRGLTLYEIRQCLPYLSIDHPHNTPFLFNLWRWWEAIALNIMINAPNRLFGLLVILSILRTFHILVYGKSDSKTKRNVLLAVGLLLVFYCVNLHEYFASGVLYRTVWSTPFSIMLIYLFFGTAMKKFSRLTHMILSITIFVIVLGRFYEKRDLVQMFNAPHHYLEMERGQVFVGNSVDWINTVRQTTQYLKRHLQRGETFFALPYDPLYYYLTGKPSPSRQLIFFEHINIPTEQEEKIIADLEENKVNYVLLSNRMLSGEAGLGIFSHTYCPILGKYIFANYREVIRFGDWQNHPGWAWNHGTAVLKRINEF